MDTVLPLELLYYITDYLKAREYLRLRICSSLTLCLLEVILVDFDARNLLVNGHRKLSLKHLIHLNAGILYILPVRC
jgi:hypothetical protein